MQSIRPARDSTLISKHPSPKFLSPRRYRPNHADAEDRAVVCPVDHCRSGAHIHVCRQRPIRPMYRYGGIFKLEGAGRVCSA